MATPQELLGGDNLTRTIQKTKSGIPLPVPQQMAVPTRRVVGNQIPYWIETGAQNLAQVIHYGAPPKGAGKKALSYKTATAIHSSHFHDYGIDEYQNLIAPDGSRQRSLGEWELARQTRTLKQRFVNLRYAAIMEALVSGVLYFDANGDMLTSATGAVFTVDFNVPAGHKDQLDVNGDGALISASWATAGTDIIGDVENILNVAGKESGLPITTALYGSDLIKLFMGNTAIQKLLGGGAGVQQAFANRTIPTGFLGIKNWIPAGTAFYKDKDGSYQDIWEGDRVVFMPDVSPNWYELVECSYVVPSQLGTVSAEAIQAAEYASTVYGMWSYAKLKDEPVSVRQIAGDTFLPMIVNNLAIYTADVVYT